ncbi:hypothetical protein [Hydrogenophaga sp.]|uniref:hypothetical protein n=1 Tax=Hydrogenophaga sp. TaxID=1904254 RepID=UPI00272354D9|nr:hypothetical protein [Hydrogenophaga sp.]MDO8904433.1 hypothetical protein [Hydrogenophaga sp.]
MNNKPLRRLSVEEATRLAESAPANTCAHCRPFSSPGWESFPATASAGALQAVGSLWLPGDDEPTLEETPRPKGVDDWSAQAPISLTLRPYNRCEIWACQHCHLPFLRYTEYGGYYVDARIRELHAERLVD